MLCGSAQKAPQWKLVWNANMAKSEHRQLAMRRIPTRAAHFATFSIGQGPQVGQGRSADATLQTAANCRAMKATSTSFLSISGFSSNVLDSNYLATFSIGHGPHVGHGRSADATLQTAANCRAMKATSTSFFSISGFSSNVLESNYLATFSIGQGPHVGHGRSADATLHTAANCRAMKAMRASFFSMIDSSLSQWGYLATFSIGHGPHVGHGRSAEATPHTAASCSARKATRTSFLSIASTFVRLYYFATFSMGHGPQVGHGRSADAIPLTTANCNARKATKAIFFNMTRAPLGAGYVDRIPGNRG